jgi:aminoglycoside-2''-adenylyltransferase
VRSVLGGAVPERTRLVVALDEPDRTCQRGGVRGVAISDEECRRRWRPWSPAEVGARLDGVGVPWGIAAGWAVDLYLGRVTRGHGDIEISVPAACFPAIADAFGQVEWDVVGAGQTWPYPEALDRFHQTWLRSPDTGEFHVDVFREPHGGSVWICRRDPTIVLDLDEVYELTDDGIPYVIPEIVLLFKARARRAKDEIDFANLVEVLPAHRRHRLASWLDRLDVQHPWSEALRR